MRRKSPHVIFSALVAAMAVVVATGMAAAAIMVFIIGTAAGALGWGCVFLNHLRVEQSWCDRHVTIRDRGTVDVTGGRSIAHTA